MVKSPRRPPLIVTLRFDATTFATLDGLRTEHYPSRLNLVPAHLTLFHNLPGDQAAEVIATAHDLARETPPFALRITKPFSLGQGVALTVDCPALAAFRARFAADWQADLTPQDRQPFRPHVTIQNKVAHAEAAQLLQRLLDTWQPLMGRGEGLQVWRYLAGPWALEADISFDPSGG